MILICILDFIPLGDLGSFILVLPLAQSLGLEDSLLLELFPFGDALRSVGVELFLEHLLHLFLDFLLINLGLLLLLLLQLFVSGRDDLTNFEPDSADLDDIALHEPMTFDVFPGIIAVPYHFPEHALWVLEEVFLLDVIERIPLLLCCFQELNLGVFGHLKCCIGPTVAELVVDPPVLTSTLCNPCDEMLLALL